MSSAPRNQPNAYDEATRLPDFAEGIANANTLPDISLRCAEVYARLASIPPRWRRSARRRGGLWRRVRSR